MSTAKIIQRQQEVHEIIIELNQIVVYVLKITIYIILLKYSKSFDYKACITRKLEGINTKIEKVKVVVPLKHLRDFEEH